MSESDSEFLLNLSRCLIQLTDEDEERLRRIAARLAELEASVEMVGRRAQEREEIF